MIYVGTCGFSYKDWLGTFYPVTIRQNEMLAYYSNCFAAVEIDASYYGVLSADTVARMNARTPAEFRFCFKVPQTVSHPPDAGLSRVHGDAAAFVESLAPIVDAGKFGCALLQFPNGFKPNDRTEAYVRAAIEALHPLTLVAEFRNREWQAPKYFQLLSDLGVGWCNVDMPGYDTLMRPSSDVSSDVGYVRFHGRNAEKWWTGDNRTRYDYDYSAEELEPWTERIAEIEEQAKTTFAFFNNHARGNAARNAELLIDMLRERYAGALSLLTPAAPKPPGQGSLFD
ncbi:MAG TPA: DUF72 domain-containing protein [Candidatus Baltobacteraceae bacterium]|nr:DUF72 domain-containing protein [Candidatus Baltobacteraceae bacterium]